VTERERERERGTVWQRSSECDMYERGTHSVEGLFVCSEVSTLRLVARRD